MLDYAVCEIGKKQYKVIPNQDLLIDYLGEEIKDVEADVLLLVEDGKMKIGNPYLKEKLNLKVIESTKGEKIRVSKYHAKANTRRTTGIRPKFTKVKLSVKK